MLPESFDPDALRAVALGGIATAAVAALIVVRLVQKVVLRVVLLGVLVGIGAYLWAERESLADCVPECSCRFAGFDVDVPGCTPPSGDDVAFS